MRTENKIFLDFNPDDEQIWINQELEIKRSKEVGDFEDILKAEGWYSGIDHNKTKKQYRYGKRLVEFIGADDEQKLRGAKRNILYCNEANELEYKQEFFQLLMRTENKIFLDFNPDDEQIWINQELEIKRSKEVGDVEVIVSNYKNCLLYTSPSPRDRTRSRMPSSA